MDWSIFFPTPRCNIACCSSANSTLLFSARPYLFSCFGCFARPIRGRRYFHEIAKVTVSEPRPVIADTSPLLRRAKLVVLNCVSQSASLVSSEANSGQPDASFALHLVFTEDLADLTE